MMKKLLRLFFLLLLILIYSPGDLNAQYYSYGQDPASQKWRQIRTDYFRLIYPETWEDQAQELAQFLETIRKPLSSSLKSNPRSIPVILRNQSMLSNGFVMWAPKRIEMVTSIPYDNQATDWMKYLSVHEYRHVVQIEAVRQSTSRFFSTIFGQHITGAVAGLHLPLWFLEGDAVLAETSFTRTGRGRLPSFTMPLHAQVLAKGIYSYDKAMFGSYRDMVPNHYTLGYHLVAATHAKYGFVPFQKAMRQVADTPFLPWSFSRGIKKVTGLGLSQVYHTVMTDLKNEWKAGIDVASVSDYTIIEPENKFDYVNYINPQHIDEDNFIAFRTTPADIPRLVKIGRDGKEKVLFTPGYGYHISMSHSNGLAAWTEINLDPRWEYRIWTNLRILDLETGKSRLITNKGRLQSPMLSPDALQVAAIEVDENNKWSLLILNTFDGEERYRITNPDIDFLMEPTWSDGGKAIVAIAFVEDKGKSIVKIHLDNSGFEHLFHAGYVEINEPVTHGQVVYFTATWSGKDELYAWDIDKQQLYKLLETPYGATSASLSADGSRMLFSDFTATGFKIGEITRKQLLPVDINSIKNLSLNLYEAAAIEENFIVDTISLLEDEFESRKINPFLNSLHFHSWVPASLDVDRMTVNPGVTAFSQDLLGSTVLASGYEYNTTNNGHTAFIDLSILSLYPHIDLRFEAGAENRFYRAEEDKIIKRRTSFARVRGGIGLPLGFNHNALIYGIHPRISTTQEIYSFTYESELLKKALRSVNYGLSINAYRRMAFRDLHPRSGIFLTAGFSHTPFKSKKIFDDIKAGEISHAAALFWLPGFMQHHSVRIYAGMQSRIIAQAYFNDRIRFARGYLSQYNEELLTLSASYSLPIWYPDLALGWLIYAKRCKANFFVDHSRLFSNGETSLWNSIGLDILVDAHLLRMPMPFEFGLRTTYLENTGDFRFEFLWGIDFYAIGQRLPGNRKRIPVY